MLISAVLILCTLKGAESLELSWGGPAEIVYDLGTIHNVRRHPDGGISLFDMELIENDSPGSGMSEKGTFSDFVWGAHRARKTLYLEDARALRAYVVIFTYSKQNKHPLLFEVNGHRGQITKDNREDYRWVEFPASALKVGKNVIDLYCPDAKTPEEGWDLYLARADEFEQGGGDPTHVGETSFSSDDGGKTWKQSPFGPDAKTKAEYSVRLSLDRYRSTGIVETPVIDLWNADSSEAIVPLQRLVEVTFEANAKLPTGTKVEYYLRRGTNPSPHGEGWEAYENVGGKADFNLTIDGEAFRRRYAQLRAVLSTSNPKVSPLLRSIKVHTQLKPQVRPLNNIFLVASVNPIIRYSSIDWQWECADVPQFEELRTRENLDEVIAGSRTQFEAQVKLMDYATQRWRDGGPFPDYPGWDALSILDRIDKVGSGGMCIQGNNFLAGLNMAYGWQGRLVNITAHETCEVWNDDFGKWIYMDGYYVNHYIHDEETGVPLSILEMHQRFLDQHYPDRVIDWMNDSFNNEAELKEYNVALGIGGDRQRGHNGIGLTAFARMVPRNNWYAAPYPRPLAHGMSWWPWDGYINWYDDRTPPKRQYSNFTDRPQDMWPDLNRVRIHATSGGDNDRLFLRFETYTPNFSHYEVNVDETGWKQVVEQWIWILQSGQNHIRVHAVSQLGVKGKESTITLNRTITLKENR